MTTGMQSEYRSSEYMHYALHDCVILFLTTSSSMWPSLTDIAVVQRKMTFSISISDVNRFFLLNTFEMRYFIITFDILCLIMRKVVNTGISI